MSVKDFIKKSVLENFSPYNVPQMAAALLAAVLLGALIYWVYQRFYAGVLFSRSFAMTLVGMSVLTCMVTLAISSNVVISLGMVGALSIVRFRTAVKDPLDLLYLFWAITAGITTGAGMYLLAASASAVMIGVLALLSRWQTAGRIYVAVLHYQGEKPGDEIVRALGRNRYAVKSKTLRGEAVEMAVEVFCRDDVRDVTDRLQEIEGVDPVQRRIPWLSGTPLRRPPACCWPGAWSGRGGSGP